MASSLKYQYANIDSNVGDKPAHQLPLSIETPSNNSGFANDESSKNNSMRVFKVVSLGLLLSGLLFAFSFDGSSDGVLGAGAPDSTDSTTAARPGYCCHFAGDKTDTCGTCVAKETTGSCGSNTPADETGCESCGATFCETPAPSPTTLIPPKAGICCHYATDATDVCGTCLAPDDGDCGLTTASCDVCIAKGGGKNTGWCPIPDIDDTITDVKDDAKTVVNKAKEDVKDDKADVNDKADVVNTDVNTDVKDDTAVAATDVTKVEDTVTDDSVKAVADTTHADTTAKDVKDDVKDDVKELSA